MKHVGYVNLATQIDPITYKVVVSAIEEFTISTTHIVVESEFFNPNSFSVSGITLSFLDINVHEVFVSKGMSIILTLEGTPRENITGSLFCLDSNDVFKILNKYCLAG